MRLVTRNHYSRVMSENIDEMHDMGFILFAPANTPITLYETFTVPAGYIAVLRSATGKVAMTPVAGQVNALLRMTRPGQPILEVFQVTSDTATVEKVVSSAYNIIMPEGTVIETYYSNFDGTAPHIVGLYLVIDLIRL